MKMTLSLKRTELERKSNSCESSESRHITHQPLYRKSILSVLSLILLFIGVGCTHQMRVKNLRDYNASPTSTGNSFDVALAPYKSNEQLRGFYKETIDALNRHPDVKIVRGQWRFHGNTDEFNPDYIVNIDISAKYKGSGWNYPITFPGCYLFICAANGYVYKADVTTEISVSTLSIDNDSSSVPKCTTPLLCSDSVPMHFNFRHCSYSRGFWSGSAWWMPGYGLHNIITGFVYVGYDSAATRSFVEKSEETYGEYIAEKIVSMIVNKQQRMEEITRLE